MSFSPLGFGTPFLLGDGLTVSESGEADEPSYSSFRARLGVGASVPSLEEGEEGGGAALLRGERLGVTDDVGRLPVCLRAVGEREGGRERGKSDRKTCRIC